MKPNRISHVPCPGQWPSRRRALKGRVLSLAFPAVAAVFLSQPAAHAVTIEAITTMPLSGGDYSNGSLQKPDGLLLDLLTAGTPASTSSRNVRSPRNNAQSFTVDAAVYPDGIEMTAFVIQFEKRGNGTDTFGVSLFKIESGNANASPLVPSANLLSGVSSLALPTAASLGVPDPTEANNGASGTAIFQFDAPLHLEPGAYAWQFLPSWTTTDLSYFDWELGASYAGGGRYEEGAGPSSDHSFGIIGTATTVLGKISWNTDDDGDWMNAGNWINGGPPDAVGEIAHLNFDITADRIITLNAEPTLGILNISDPAGDFFSYTISGSGSLVLNNGGNAIQINKTQNASIIDFTGPNPNNGLNPNTAHDVIGVPVELQGDLVVRNNALNGILEFSETIGNDGTNRNVTVRGPNLGGTTPDGQGGEALVIFSAANTYGGDTTINNGGRLRITHGQGLGTGGIASIAGGNQNGVSSLELAGDITVENHVGEIRGTTFKPDTVGRIASVSGNNEFAGNIQNVNVGGEYYPILSTGTAPGDFFTFSGDIINARTQAETTRILWLGGSGDGEVTGEIRETGNSYWNVVKAHAGTWTISSDNSYRGTTTVEGGRLRIDGTHTGSGAYTVQSGGTLEVNGTLSNDLVDVHVLSGSTLSGTGAIAGWIIEMSGVISPGPGIDTLAIGNVQSFQGTYNVEIGGAQADKLVVNGNLTLDDATLSVTSISPPTASSYVIATYTGSLFGSFLNVPPGYEVDTDSTPGEVILIKLPGRPYGTWMDSFPSLAGDDREPEADPDGDGIPNGVEYVLGGDPTQSSLHLLPQIGVSGDDIVFTFQRDAASEDGITEVYVQYGTNLSDWDDLPVPEAPGVYGQVTVGESGDITVTIPKDGDAKKFVRLKVEVE